MRKFTLLFLSMFLWVGALVAQDGALTLISSNPSSETIVSRVDYIQLDFSKEVTITLPEEPIIIKHTVTGEEYCIVAGNAYSYDGYMAVFNIGKADDENVYNINSIDENGSLNKDILGTYTYTIPAGCITSVDGEVFAEQTFTFTIGEPMSVVKVTPDENGTEKLEQIQITFSKDIESVVYPEGGISIVDDYWNPVALIEEDITIGEDKRTVTLNLDTPITTPGKYNLDLRNGLFISADGMKSDYATLSFTVIDTKPSFITNITNGSRVQELANSFEITFKNVNEVALVDGAEDVVVYIPGASELYGTVSLENNKITVEFEEEFLEEGTYTFVIPAGLFTMDGVENERQEIYVELYSFTITPLEVVSVTPVLGEVDKIERIVIEFNQNINLYYGEDTEWQTPSNEIELTDGENVYTLTYAPTNYNISNVVEYLVNAEWDRYDYVSTPITAAGTYTMDLSDIIVFYAGESYIDEWGYPATRWYANGSCKGTYSWTIKPNDTGIDSVLTEEEGENVIYDLTGRAVKTATKAGIYIVNGKKVLVK